MKKSFGKKLVALALAGMLSFGAVPQEVLSKLVGDTIAKFLYIVPQSTLMNARADSDYPDTASYSWNGYTRATATKKEWDASAQDYTLTSESETTTNIKSRVTTQPTCTTKGIEKYTAYFSSAWAGTDSNYKTLPALGHDWGDTEYEWDEEYTSVTAKRVCQRDEEHSETETADTVSSEVTKEATCEETGKMKYYSAGFENEAFEAQTTEIDTDSLGHDWKEAEYVWNDDNTEVTATRGCTRCEKEETETVKTTYNEITAAGCESKGKGKYTSAEFENEAFTVQTKEVDTDPLGHDLEKKNAKESTYLEEGNIEYYVCKRCGKIFRDPEGKHEITMADTVVPRKRNPGDVNLDGEVNIKDVALMKQYLAKWNVSFIYLPNFDVNGDGQYTIADVARLKQYLAKWNVTLE